MSDLVQVLETVFADLVPAVGRMGVEVETAEPGRAVLRLPWSEDNRNHLDTVYAGVLFSFLEASGGALVLGAIDVAERIPVMVESTIRYLRPARGTIRCALEIDDAARAALAAQLDADPRARWTLTARATDENGTVVCEADLVYRFKAVG